MRGGDRAGHLERAGDRPVLRDQFADHHLDHGGEQHAEDHGDTAGGSVGEADGAEQGLQQGRQRGFGEHADDQRGDGDAQLGAGEFEGEVAQGPGDPAGLGVPGGGGALDGAALHGHEGELGGHEEAVGEDEQEGCEKQQPGRDHSAACRPSVGGWAAQVLPDGSSMDGECHSSGRFRAGQCLCPAFASVDHTRATVGSTFGRGRASDSGHRAPVTGPPPEGVGRCVSAGACRPVAGQPPWRATRSRRARASAIA